MSYTDKAFTNDPKGAVALTTHGVVKAALAGQGGLSLNVIVNLEKSPLTFLTITIMATLNHNVRNNGGKTVGAQVALTAL